MNKFRVLITLAVVGLVAAEPPVSSGYAYSGPSISHTSIISSGSGGGFGGGGYALGHGDSYSGGGGFGGIGGGLGGISGHYTAVSPGYQTSEGKYVDPVLLHKVKEILLDQENQQASHFGGGGGGGHGHGGLSLTYGAPSSHYGVPSYAGGYGGRVVGIELGHIRQGIQVAQYHQHGYASVPSGSYGVPSGSYGVPHH